MPVILAITRSLLSIIGNSRLLNLIAPDKRLIKKRKTPDRKRAAGKLLGISIALFCWLHITRLALKLKLRGFELQAIIHNYCQTPICLEYSSDTAYLGNESGRWVPDGPLCDSESIETPWPTHYPPHTYKSPGPPWGCIQIFHTDFSSGTGHHPGCADHRF